mmetsp:Transcript_6307/g.15633  ORF Transcript_6307/g.15633 Transcript_6307/m.15633 type:complete len:258 (+) Transcript_6307:55-828(+)
MCITTVDQEEEKKQAKTALHLSSSLQNTSPLGGDSLEDNIGYSRSPITRLFKKADGDDRENIKSVSVSFSADQATVERSQGVHNFSFSDVEGTNDLDHRNSSFIVNEDKNTADFGSISEAKICDENDDHVGSKSKNFCADMIMLPVGVCQGSTEFAEQMDIFMRCQHPLDILSIFHEEGTESGTTGTGYDLPLSDDAGEDANVHRPIGYHAIPRSCEYCGSPNIDLCRDSLECERPKTYFPRETPPFCSKGGVRNIY